MYQENCLNRVDPLQIADLILRGQRCLILEENLLKNAPASREYINSFMLNAERKSETISALTAAYSRLSVPSGKTEPEAIHLVLWDIALV